MTAADRPSVTDNARAEAWDEGYQDGLRQGGEGEDGPRYVNPHRAAGRAETTTGCEHGGQLIRKFDGGRSAILCEKCMTILGYMPPERPAETTTEHRQACHDGNRDPDCAECYPPAAALSVAQEAAIRAESWDEGYRAGLKDDGPDSGEVTNPYRAAAGRAETTTATDEDAAARLAAAEAELDRLCNGGRFIMSVPPREGYDSDLLIQAALTDLRGLLATARTRPTETMTEWGIRVAGRDRPCSGEAGAREMARSLRRKVGDDVTVVRREVAPWTEADQ